MTRYATGLGIVSSLFALATVASQQPGQRSADLAEARVALATNQQLHGDGDHPAIAAAHNDLGMCLQDIGQPQLALSHCEAAAEMYERLHGDIDHADVAGAVYNIATSLLALGRPQDALVRAEAADAMLRRVHGDGDHPHIAASVTMVADCMRSLGDSPGALRKYRDALAMLRRFHGAGPHAAVATALQRVGDCLRDLGQSAEALQMSERALAVHQELHGDRDHPDKCSAHNSVAAGFQALGRLPEALSHYRAALEMMRRITGGADHADFAVVMLNTGRCTRDLGRPGDALPLLERAVAMFRRLSGDADHPNVAMGLDKVGFCLMDLGRADEGRAHLEAALAMAQRLFGEGAHPIAANAHNSLASCLDSLGAPSEALPHFEAALAMYRQLAGGRDHPYVATAANNLGGCLKSLRRYEEGLAQYQAALAMNRRLLGHVDHAHLAKGLNNVAACLQDLERDGEALVKYEAALAMHRRLYEGQNHPDVVMSLNNVAWCHERLGRPRAALPRIAEACDMIDALRSESSISAAVRQSFFDELKRFGAFDRMQTIAHAAGEPALAVRALEHGRNRELLDLMERHADAVTEDEQAATRHGDGSKAARLAAVRGEMATARLERDRLLHELTSLGDASTEDAERDGVRQRLLTRSNAVDARLRKLRDEHARLTGNSQQTARVKTAEEIRGALREDELLLAFTITAKAGMLFVIAPEGEPQIFALPKAAETIEQTLASVMPPRAVTQLRGLVPRAENRPVDRVAAARSLFESLMPADVWTRVRACRRVYVAAHRQLHRLPFELLVTGDVDGKPSRWLDQGPPISYVPSGSILHWLRTRAASTAAGEGHLDLLAIGDPRSRTQDATADADASRTGELEPLAELPPLLGARKEAEDIVAMFAEHGHSARALVGRQGTEPEVFDLAARASFLHFACHGIAAEHAGRSLSMLVLARPRTVQPGDDGLLKLDDLLEAWRGRLAASRLVVLSACRTNVGPLLRDASPQALPIGFLAAGTPAVISSLWAVDDESTRVLMADFYGRVLAGETDLLAAFTAAKRALRERYDDPFHWAPFLYLGTPD